MSRIEPDVEEFHIRYCDICKEVCISSHLHFPDKDFAICKRCVFVVFEKMYGNPYEQHDPSPVKWKKEKIPNDLKWDIWERDGSECQYCGARKHLSIDHIIPESQGGTLVKTNLVTACKTCNSRKGPRTPEQAGMTIINDPRM